MNSLYIALKRGKMDETSRVLFNKHFSHCTVTLKKEDLAGNGKLVEYYSVEPNWMGVDRPHTGGWSVGKDNIVLAERLQRAVVSGAAFCLLEVKTDIDKKTYIGATDLVRGRAMNADLNKLGY